MHPTESPLSTPRPADEFERFFMLAFDMCCVASLDGFFRRVNPAFVKGLGYSEEELLARCFLELVHPEDVARTQAELASLAQSDGSHAFQNRYRHRDGTYRWLEWTPSQVSPEGRIYAVARDVTEQYRTNEALRESERRYRLLAENSTDIILLTSPQGEIRYASPACERMLGVGPLELLGRMSFELIHPDDLETATRGHLEAMRTGTAQAIYRVCAPERPEIWLEVLKKAVHDPETGELVAVQSVSRDITQRCELDRMKDQFVSTVAHELRTPLSAIYGSLRLIASGKLATDPAANQRIVDIAVSNTERLTRLIDDLLAFERLRDGRAVMEKEACNAENLLLQVEDTMAPVAEKAGVRLQIDLVSIAMWADPDRVIQVLLNLVDNAVKFTPPGGAIRVSARDEGHGVRFEVQDEGRGIPEAMRERIFERFQQVTSSDAREKGGAGLGLAICRGLVEAHGGRIGVEGAPGQGSTFGFTLPHKPAG